MHKNNKELVESLKRKDILKSPDIIKAFLDVDRRDFVADMFKDESYEDYALPTFEGQTISQPQVVSFMLEKLKVRAGDKILDIGAGSGWVATLLATLTGKDGFVWAYEIKKDVGKFGQENIKKYPFKNYSYIIGDVKAMWAENAPYDKIVSGAAFPYIEEDFYKHLKEGGIAVIPTVDNEIVVVKKDKNGKIHRESYYGFVFVPLV